MRVVFKNYKCDGEIRFSSFMGNAHRSIRLVVLSKLESVNTIPKVRLVGRTHTRPVKLMYIKNVIFIAFQESS